MANHKQEGRKPVGTTVTIHGACGETGVGGSCYEILNVDSDQNKVRVLVDYGFKMAECDHIYDAVFADMSKNLGTTKAPAQEPIDALLITHTHFDHIQAMLDMLGAELPNGEKFRLPPIYTTPYGALFIEKQMSKSGVSVEMRPKVNRIEPGDKILFGSEHKGEIVKKKDIKNGRYNPKDAHLIVSPFAMSHTAANSVGYHILTKVMGNDESGLVFSGDGHMRQTMIGHTGSLDELSQIVNSNLTTTMFMDGTSELSNSPVPSVEERVEAYKNVMTAENDKQIYSSVISGSLDNLMPILKAAKETDRKVFLQAPGLKVSADTAELSGLLKEYEDIIVKGSREDFNEKVALNKRIIILSGPFADGAGTYIKENAGKSELVKYAEEQSDKSQDVFIVSQKCVGGKWIDEDGKRFHTEGINESGMKEVYNNIAKAGAKIYENKSSAIVLVKNSNREFDFQPSGHMNAKECAEIIGLAKDKNVMVAGVHGDNEQRNTVENIAKNLGYKIAHVNNGDVLRADKDGIEKIAEDKRDLLAVRDEKVAGAPNMRTLHIEKVEAQSFPNQYGEIQEIYQKTGDFAFKNIGVVVGKVTDKEMNKFKKQTKFKSSSTSKQRD